MRKDPGIAALLSFFVAGAGQIYVGAVGRGLVIFGGFVLLWILFLFDGLLPLIGLIYWIWNVYDAYNLAKKFPVQ